MSPSTDLAHVVVAGAGVTVALWVAMVLMLGGGAACLLARARWQRMSGAVLIVVGVAGTVGAGFAAAAPAPPAYSISVARPSVGAQVTSPVLVQVCGRLPGGARIDIPGPGQVLSVFIDGRQLQTTTMATAFVAAQAGRHTLRVEILSTDHREYQPPLATDIPVMVTGPGPLGSASTCLP